MILPDQEALSLKKYLVRQLEPICDAEPSVLADYVIALLKHDKPTNELQILCQSQLEDFLREETAPFLKDLFKALANKSFVKSTGTPATLPIGGTIQGGSRNEKRKIEEESSLDSRDNLNRHNRDNRDDEMIEDISSSSETQQSIQVWQDQDARPSKMARGSNGRRYDPRDSRGEARQGRGGRLGNGTLPPRRRKGICHSFTDKGYCTRGESCPYDHIPGGELRGQQPPPLYMGGPGLGPMRPHYNPSLGPTPYNGMMMMMAPNDEQGYDPENANISLPLRLGPSSGMNEVNSNGEYSIPLVNDERIKSSTPSTPYSQSRGGRHGAGFGRNQGRSKTTLMVDKIPPENFNLESVNSYFKRFGNLVNIRLDPKGGRATLQFETPAQAQAAHGSPEPIFGNRFVKVYFAKELELAGQTDLGQQKSDKPEPTHPSSAAPLAEPPKTPQQIALERSKQMLELQKSKEALIAKQIQEQKDIMAKLSSGVHMTVDEKKSLMEQLKVLTSSTQSLVAKATVQTQIVAQTAAAAAQTSTGASAPSSSTLPSKKATLEKNKLDMELDLLKQIASSAKDSDTVDPTLQSKLEMLQKEARSLGMTSYAGTGFSPGSRGRGRGRGGMARGGASHLPLHRSRSLRLDNRVRKLKVVGTDPNFFESLQEHCKTLEGIESLEGLADNQSALITFKTRKEAEAAIVKPIKVSGLEGIQVTWDKEETLDTTEGPSPTDPEEVWGGEEDHEPLWKRL